MQGIRLLQLLLIEGFELRSLLRRINIKGELFASTFAYAVTAVIKLGSSLILTRLLDPQSYGIFGVLTSILFIIELLTDVGTTALLIRHPRGSDRQFVHTVWTVRLIRSLVTSSAMFFGAPLIAQLYSTPLLASAFRVLSLWFLISGTETMAFILAQRDRKARISNYMDLATVSVTTVAVIGAALLLHNQYALILGSLLQRALISAASYFFYREVGVGIAFDKDALAEQFRFARIVLPSSILTLVLSQYDKLILLKFFDIAVVGVYVVASNMLAPINGLITHNARVVLYARCADYFRSDWASARSRYYSENKSLLVVGVLLPSVLAGLSPAAVTILYDARYNMAGSLLMITAIGAVLFAFQQASENLLVAAGKTHMVLASNVVRLVCIVPASILGFHLFGLYGFLWFTVAASIPLLLYFFYIQAQLGLFHVNQELKLLAVAAGAFLVSLAAGHLLLQILPSTWLHLGTHRH